MFTRGHPVAPAGASEDVVSEGKRVFEVILLHNPRRTQAAAGEIILDEVLLEHNFFENFGEGIAAGVGGVLLLFRYRYGMGIEKMSQGGVAANQNDLPE